MENLEEKLPFIINPNLRLNSPNFNISWHLVDFNILQTEATFPCNGRKSFFHGKRYELIVQYNEEQLDIIYSSKTDWDILKLQQWIRMVIRDAIIKRAEQVLPMRLHYWEREKNIYANKVIVSPLLRENVMGNCSWEKEIRLAPIVVLFPQAYLDEVILHEMAHLKYMHHRKSFWQHLSGLLGRDANQAKIESSLFFCKYAELFYFIMQK